MKKVITTTLISLAFLITVSGAQAQMPAPSRVEGMGTIAPDDHTAREEAQGKAMWQRLQNKEIKCGDLSDDDFGALGEYFMGQMMGSSHSAMNQMMVNMMGEKGEKQTHIVMGKRLSGCNTTATFSSQGMGFMPMMNMMTAGWSSPFGFNQTNPEGVPRRGSGLCGAGNPMMWGNNPMGWGFGAFGWIFMILWWALIIAGLVALIKWLTSQSQGSHRRDKSPLEILKERYAKGEIDKKEFEERKKDLS